MFSKKNHLHTIRFRNSLKMGNVKKVEKHTNLEKKYNDTPNFNLISLLENFGENMYHFHHF